MLCFWSIWTLNTLLCHFSARFGQPNSYSPIYFWRIKNKSALILVFKRYKSLPLHGAVNIHILICLWIIQLRQFCKSFDQYGQQTLSLDAFQPDLANPILILQFIWWCSENMSCISIDVRNGQVFFLFMEPLIFKN